MPRRALEALQGTIVVIPPVYGYEMIIRRSSGRVTHGAHPK